MNPELEMARFLTERHRLASVPPFLGALEYKKEGQEDITVLCLLTGAVPNQGDAWQFTLDFVRRYFERVLARMPDLKNLSNLQFTIFSGELKDIQHEAHELIGSFFLEMIELLGKRTAELHLTLALDSGDSDFAMEPFTVYYQRSLYQSISSLVRRNLQILRKNIDKLPESVKEEATYVLSKEYEILETTEAILKLKIKGMKIRHHGDYHLGQVLFTGNDFVIIDFEGEPARTLSERKIKRSPLRDAAGMIRSFHYAAYTELLHLSKQNAEYLSTLEPWAMLWYNYVARTFLTSYLHHLGDSPLVSKEQEEIKTMLKVYLIEKAVYEIGYELNNRPDWVIVPIRGVMSLLSS
jgi:maltose alpha-D-glucosyltransferase/alpha-amylase